MTEGAEPYEVKASRTVLNGGREETYPQGNAPCAYPPGANALRKADALIWNPDEGGVAERA
jgi:hypothetical protein